jgi:hypothetical protein
LVSLMSAQSLVVAATTDNCADLRNFRSNRRF